MKRALKFLSIILLAGAAQLAARGQATASAPAESQSNPQWEGLLQRLGAADFAARESAQKELDQLTALDLERLRRAADRATDPEVKARLAARAQAIEDDLALNPRPVSLELKDATLAEVAAALSKELGVKLDSWPNNGREDGVYTISAKNMPFWQVYIDLCKQRPFRLEDMGRDLRLMDNRGTPLNRYVIAGPLLIIPQSITRQRSSNLQEAPGKEVGAESMSFNYMVGVDPRLRLIRYSQPQIVSAVDNEQKQLLKAPNNNVMDMVWEASDRRTGFISNSADLQLLNGKSTRMSAKGALHMLVQLGEESLEMAEVEKKVGASVELLGATITVQNFTVQGANNDSINMNLKMTGTLAAPEGMPGANGPLVNYRSQPFIKVTVQDSENRQVFSSTMRGGGMGMGTGGGQFKPPFKMKLSIATKVKEVTLPFEMKDLPLP